MRAIRPSTESLRRRFACVAGALLVVAACGDGQPAAPRSAAAPSPAPAAAAAGRAPSSSSTTGTRLTMSTASTTCGGSGAHDAHAAKGITCQACHPCGGGFGFANVVTFPGGTTDANGTITVNGLNTTCSVGCHSPLGAPAHTVAWNAGPLACTDCHSNVATSSNVVSSHFVGVTNPAAACQLCHDLSKHTQGQVYLLAADGSSSLASCLGCHSGQGQTLAGNTPPLLFGWTDAVNGDFHGARAGTGLGGGTLASPYYLGYPPIECTTCHDPHSSGNAFIFAGTVNGTTVAPGTITRAGVGAEVLCNACHQGDHHAYCKTCHTVAMKLDTNGVLVFDPTSGPADPEPPGSACFYCHGHEGIVSWPAPGSYANMTGDIINDPTCFHCHGYKPPTNLNSPPVIQQGKLSGGGITPAPAWFPSPPFLLAPGGNVFNVGSTSASIWWETDRSATTFVEWGPTAPGFVSGYPTTPAPTLAYPYELFPPPYQAQVYHRVDLTGLAASTTYVWRIRTVDQFRNVTETALSTFTTSAANAPPAPTLVLEPMQYNANPNAIPVLTFPVSPPLTWNAVAYQGHAMQYRVLLANDTAFTKNVVDSGWIAGTSFAANVTGTMDAGYATYYWRVMAMDTTSGVTSAWSPLGTFQVFVDDPYLY